MQVAPIARPDTERRTQDARLVAPTRMIGIERVRHELVGRDDRLTSSGQVGRTSHRDEATRASGPELTRGCTVAWAPTPLLSAW